MKKWTYIYLIRNPENGLIKIGKTDYPEERRRQLSTAAGVELEIICTILAPDTLEKTLHKRFAESRKIGEWFDPDKALLEFVDSGARRPDLFISKLPNGTPSQRSHRNTTPKRQSPPSIWARIKAIFRHAHNWPSSKKEIIVVYLTAHPEHLELPARELAELISEIAPKSVSHTLVNQVKKELPQ